MSSANSRGLLWLSTTLLTLWLAAGCGEATEEERTALLEEIEKFSSSGHHEEGLVRAKEGQKLAPNDSRFYFYEGLLLNASGDYAGAESAVHHAVELRPDHYPSYRVLGELAQRRGAPGEAADYYGRCVAGLPDDDVCQYGLGVALVELGQLDAAAEALRIAVEVRHRANVWSELGKVERGRRQLDAAIEAFAQALRIDSVHLPSLLGMGQVLLAAGRQEEGSALLERHREEAALQDRLEAAHRAAAQPDASVDVVLQLAELCRRRNDLEAAESALRRALAMAPEFVPARLALANHLLHQREIGDAETLIEGLGTEQAKDPAVLFLRGTIAVARRDEHAAKRHFEDSIARGPWPPSLVVEAGTAWLSAGFPQRAAEAFEQAIIGMPEATEAYLGLAQSQHAGGAASRALATTRRVLELDRTDGHAALLLGVLQAHLGNTPQARSAFLQALQNFKLELLPAGGADEIRRDLDALEPTQVAIEVFEQELETYLAQRGARS